MYSISYNKSANLPPILPYLTIIQNLPNRRQTLANPIAQITLTHVF